MIPQIIGSKKCKETQKLERFFKEKSIKYQFICLEERSLSSKEWNDIFKKYSANDLINKEGKIFRNSNLSFMDYDDEEILKDNNRLLKTPLLRVSSGVYKDISREKVLDICKHTLLTNKK